MFSMEQYFVEGLFLTSRSLKKSRQLGRNARSEADLFSQSFWANSAEEALQMATEALNDGRWVEEPKVSKISEEIRMRAMGAPELPGLSFPKKKRKIGKK
jgi:hypothetical protein